MRRGRIDIALSTAPVVTCMITLMMVFNFIFWVTGVVILAVGIWTKVDLYKYLELSTVYMPEAPYILIGAGVAIVMVGSLGCCCTLKGRYILLMLYCGFLFLIFILELSAGITLLVYKEKLENGFEDGLENSMEKYGKRGNEEVTDAFDELQIKLKCCGITHYEDWFTSPWGQEQPEENTVPVSCCYGHTPTCKNTNLPPMINDSTFPVFTHGCHRLVVDFINGNMGPIGGVALGISFFQVLGAILAYCLAKTIHKTSYQQMD